MNPYSILGAVVVALVGLVFFFARLGAEFPKAWRAVKSIASAPFVLERIWAEFSTNGGSSLRDRVDATHRFAAEAATEARLARAMSEASAHRLGVELDAINHRIDAHEEAHHGIR